MKHQGTKLDALKIDGADYDLTENSNYKFVGCIKPGAKYGENQDDIIELNEGHMFVNNFKKKE